MKTKKEKEMGAFIVLVIVIIVIVVVVKANKKKKAFEELANSDVYQVVLRIKSELEKNGYSVSDDMFELGIYRDGVATGRGGVYSHGGAWVMWGYIAFSLFRRAFGSDEHQFRMSRAGGKRVYALQNDNIGIFVYSEEDSQEVPTFIEIAAEVIKKFGYGTSTLLDS